MRSILQRVMQQELQTIITGFIVEVKLQRRTVQLNETQSKNEEAHRRISIKIMLRL